MPWVARRLRGAKIFVACDQNGEPTVGPDQRVDVLYRSGGKVYRAAARNLSEDDDKKVRSDEEVRPATESDDAAAAAPRTKAAGSRGTATKAAAGKHPHLSAHALANAVHIYTDGACTGNPGPMGIGVVILDPSGAEGAPLRREAGEYLGTGTNNIAELTAILRGLQLTARDRAVVIYTDSSYSIGILSLGWKAKANQELVAEIRALLRTFPQVRFVKVAGHAGVPENERCDELARQAVMRRS
ncbi:MAG: ribonuclease HI [Myxococcales bacterium]|nr:ribonuclease HI [Myxococcales bacterium]